MQAQKQFDPLAQNLPTDEVAERLLIHTAIQWERRLREAIAHIRPEHLNRETHRILWTAVCAMYDASRHVSRETVFAHFASGPGESQLQAITVGYLSEFMTPAADIPLTQEITKILDCYARRVLMFKCNDMLLRLTDRTEDRVAMAHELAETAQASVAISMESSGFKNFEDMIRESGGIEAFLSRGKGESVTYPWPSLNHLTRGGMKPGQFIVIAGLSGKGKTALVMNIVLRAAFSGIGTPLVFSLEVPKEEIGTRMLALASGVDSYHFDNLDEDERTRIREGRRILNEQEYLVDDEDSATMSAIRAKTKTMLARCPVSVVVIDTIQLVEGRKGVKENREQEIATITRSMKRMAMQLKIPVIGVSQLNDVEDGKEPGIKNLRDSRTIWHNANVLMFLHFTRPYDMKAGIPTGDLDLIVAKHREGAEGRIALEFHAPTGSFFERDGVRSYES